MLFEKIAKKHKKWAETNALFSPKKSPRKIPKIRTKTDLRLGFPGRFISVFAERVPAKTVRKVQKNR